MDLAWCLVCEKKLQSDENLYCSEQCQMVDFQWPQQCVINPVLSNSHGLPSLSNTRTQSNFSGLGLLQSSPHQQQKWSWMPHPESSPTLVRSPNHPSKNNETSGLTTSDQNQLQPQVFEIHPLDSCHLVRSNAGGVSTERSVKKPLVYMPVKTSKKSMPHGRGLEHAFLATSLTSSSSCSSRSPTPFRDSSPIRKLLLESPSPPTRQSCSLTGRKIHSTHLEDKSHQRNQAYSALLSTTRLNASKAWVDLSSPMEDPISNKVLGTFLPSFRLPGESTPHHKTAISSSSASLSQKSHTFSTWKKNCDPCPYTITVSFPPRFVNLGR